MATIYHFLNKEGKDMLTRLKDPQGVWQKDLVRIGCDDFTLMAKIDANVVALTTNDVVQALTIPADTLVTQVLVHLETAEGATCTVDVGDATANRWHNDINMNGTADAISTNSTCVYFGSEDTIDVLMNNNAANLVMDVIAKCVRVGRLR